MNAETLMLIAGVSGSLLTIHWARTRKLRERYALPWLMVAAMLLICGLFPGLIKTFADAWHLSYPSAVMLIALTMIYTYSFFVSVALSRQYRRSAKLAQEVALLEARLRVLEMKGNG
jgi:hypothetical protein